MARDRDPFDRTLETLRRRLVDGAPLQGVALPVKALAAELGVSPTPVREALSRLAGEGLVARTAAGYAGVIHDARSLAELYHLAGVLLGGLVSASPAPAASASVSETLDWLEAEAGDQTLATAFRRVRAQISPFAAAERKCLSPERWPPASADLAVSLRRYYARRAHRSGDILGAAIAAQIGSRI